VKRAEKAERIAKILDQLHPRPADPFRRSDPYRLLVSVVLSAQCTDERVAQVAPQLFARASTPAQMLELSTPQIRSVIRPCGLAPSKSRNIRKLSAILVERHGGRVPRSFEELEALPGVGHKSASVVMMQAFREPAFPVDTHIHRLAARWGLSSGRNVETTEADLKRLFPQPDWPKLHLQIIDFGRAYCPARRHDLAMCPICSWAATRKRIAEEAARSR
jgi:endonuclease-3